MNAKLNGVDIYYEVRGSGPAVLMISGATGDAGHFEKAAAILSADYTVITYDRRGNSRSTAGAVEAATLDQHADDAAALIRHVGAAPTVVFGTSGGAVIALKLALRTPGIARSFIVHEPPLMQVLPEADELGRMFQAKVAEGLAAAGPVGAMELFIRENAGSAVFDRLDPVLRQRMLANGPWFFDHELAMFTTWVPSLAELAAVRAPMRVLAGRDNRGNYHYRAAAWLANALGIRLGEIPGTHAPYLAAPGEFAAALRPLLDADPVPAATA